MLCLLLFVIKSDAFHSAAIFSRFILAWRLPFSTQHRQFPFDVDFSRLDANFFFFLTWRRPCPTFPRLLATFSGPAPTFLTPQRCFPDLLDTFSGQMTTISTPQRFFLAWRLLFPNVFPSLDGDFFPLGTVAYRLPTFPDLWLLLPAQLRLFPLCRYVFPMYSSLATTIHDPTTMFSPSSVTFFASTVTFLTPPRIFSA